MWNNDLANRRRESESGSQRLEQWGMRERGRMSACECLDVYLAVNSSDWKGRKTDILTLKIMNAETGCLVLTVQGDEITTLCTLRPVGKLQKTSILSSRSGSASGLNSYRGWNCSASSATFHEFIKKTNQKTPTKILFFSKTYKAKHNTSKAHSQLFSVFPKFRYN